VTTKQGVEEYPIEVAVGSMRGREVNVMPTLASGMAERRMGTAAPWARSK